MKFLTRGTACPWFRHVFRFLRKSSFISLGARPAVLPPGVAFVALTPVAAHGVDADVRAQRPIAGGTLVNVEAIRLLPVPVPLPIVAVPGIASAQHPSEVICALLFTRSFSTHIVVFGDALSKNKLITLTAFFPEK